MPSCETKAIFPFVDAEILATSYFNKDTRCIVSYTLSIKSIPLFVRFKDACRMFSNSGCDEASIVAANSLHIDMCYMDQLCWNVCM